MKILTNVPIKNITIPTNVQTLQTAHDKKSKIEEFLKKNILYFYSYFNVFNFFNVSISLLF